MKLSLQGIQDLILVAIGNFVIALGVNLFFLPCNILSGGVSGIAVAIEPIFHIPPTWVINGLTIILFLLGASVLGKEFALKTIVSTFIYPLCISVLNYLLKDIHVTDNAILASIYGGLCAGIGIGLVYKAGASSGGMDIPPLVINKFTKIPLPFLVMCTDGSVVVLGALIHGIEATMIGLVSVYVCGQAINKVLTMGSHGAKKLLIISDHHEVLLDEIFKNVKRGATVIHGHGGYTKTNKPIIMMVVLHKQYPVVDRIITSVDPDAFVIVSDVNEVHGLGFTYQESL